ncbi:MAG: DUF4276 family protein [Rhodoglobus sp.]
MHIEFLVEDLSGKVALEQLVPKIIESDHTVKISPYRGIGRVPKNMSPNTEASKRILLDQLPKLLQGLGKTFRGYGADYAAAVVVICDLDNKNLEKFLVELTEMVDACDPRPETRFCLAIEEGEAWFLGDVMAIRTAYPKAKNNILENYVQDSICGTWEILADAIHDGGSSAVKALGWHKTGRLKSEWARNITPHMDVEKNESGSFAHFRDSLRELVRNPDPAG